MAKLKKRFKKIVKWDNTKSIIHLIVCLCAILYVIYAMFLDDKIVKVIALLIFLAMLFWFMLFDTEDFILKREVYYEEL